MNGLVLRSAIVAALGGLIFGFDTAVISGTDATAHPVYELSPGGLGFTVATALIGTIFGALIARQTGRPLRRARRCCSRSASCTSSARWAAPSLSNLALFLIFRFLGGIGVGVAWSCAPIYTAEIAPPAHRGRLVGLVQFNIVLGILLAYRVQRVIAALLPAEIAWRWMLGVMAVPAVIFFLLLFTVPETPRWLLRRSDRRDEAVAVIDRTAQSEGRGRVRDPRDRGVARRAARAAAGRRSSRASTARSSCWPSRSPSSTSCPGSTRSSTTRPDIFRTAGAGDNAAAPGERRHRPGQPRHHHGRADGDRQDRPAQADDRRFDRLPGQPGRPRRGVLRLRGSVLTASPASSCWAASWCSSPRTRSARAR